MKYIRTKDGRILKVFCESISMFAENDGCTYYGENTVDFETSLFMPKSKIIKKSNTIEELCDEIVYFNNIKPHLIRVHHNYITYKDNFMVHDKLTTLLQEGIIYGAIWTDNGLIYVAKMNNKGELELL